MKNIGVASKPSTRSPHSLLTDGENGPLMRFAPLARSQSSAAWVSARNDLDVVDCVERAELRTGGADRRDAGLIDLRHDAADPLAIAAGEKFLLFDELVMRIELMREDAPALDVERRREALRAVIEQPRQPAEGRKAQRAVDRKNLDPRHMQVLAAAGLNRKRQSDAGGQR